VEVNQVLQGDCLELIRSLEQNSIKTDKPQQLFLLR
jgi:hypothetical protein